MRPTTLFLVCLAVALGPECQAQPAPGFEPQDRSAARPRPQLPPETKVLRNLEYAPGGHDRQKLDLYIPSGASTPLPLVIWIHGGAWKAGSKENPMALRLLQHGYAVAAINYRLSQHAIFPAQLEDCKAAIRWLRAHAGEHNLDPKRFAAFGASAGGHLAAFLGVTGDVKEFDRGENLKESSAVQAVVNYFGPADLLAMAAQSGPESRMNHDAPDSPESLLIGGEIQKNATAARRASPITYVSAGDAPMLLVHGTADPVVPAEQSRSLYRELQKAKVPSKLHLVDGAGHGNGFGPKEAEAVRDFLATYLKPGAAR